MMKIFGKIGLMILSFSLLFFVGNLIEAKDYEFTNLDIQADVKIDGTIDVTETFTTNFLKKKHGIVRFIPLNYTVEDTDFHIDLDYIRVDGNKFTTYTEDGGMNIKIGDPDIEIKGEKVYPIFYSVYGLVRNFAGMGYHELYWNIVGYDFDTNINRVRAEIHLPKKYNGFTSEDFLITVDGKTTDVNSFDGTIDRSDGDRILITYNKKLDAGEGITLAVKFPKDYFEFDHDKQASLLGHVGGGSNYNYNSNSSSFLSNLFSDSDSLSSILTFLIIIFGMFFMPNNGGSSYSSGGSYSRSGGFSSGSSFSGGFSRGGGGGGGGSRSW